MPASISTKDSPIHRLGTAMSIGMKSHFSARKPAVQGSILDSHLRRNSRSIRLSCILIPQYCSRKLRNHPLSTCVISAPRISREHTTSMRTREHTRIYVRTSVICVIRLSSGSMTVSDMWINSTQTSIQLNWSLQMRFSLKVTILMTVGTNRVGYECGEEQVDIEGLY